METPSDCSEFEPSMIGAGSPDNNHAGQGTNAMRLEDDLLPEAHVPRRSSSRSHFCGRLSVSEDTGSDNSDCEDGSVYDDSHEGEILGSTSAEPKLLRALRECLLGDVPPELLEYGRIALPPSGHIDPSEMSRGEVEEIFRCVERQNVRFWASDVEPVASITTHADIDLYRLVYAEAEDFGAIRLFPKRKMGRFCKDNLKIFLPNGTGVDIRGKPTFCFGVVGRRNANIDLLIIPKEETGFRWDSFRWSEVNSILLDSFSVCQGPAPNAVGMAAAPQGDILLDVRESACKAFLHDVLKTLRCQEWMRGKALVYLYVHSCGHGDFEVLSDSSYMDDLISNAVSLVDGVVDIGIEFDMRTPHPNVLLFRKSFLMWALGNDKGLHPKLLLENVADATVHYSANSWFTKEKVYTTDVYTWRFRGVVPFAGAMPLAPWAAGRTAFLDHLPGAMRARVEKCDQRQTSDIVIVQEATNRLRDTNCPARYELTVKARSFVSIAGEVIDFCHEANTASQAHIGALFIPIVSARYADYMQAVVSTPMKMSRELFVKANDKLARICSELVRSGSTERFESVLHVAETTFSEITVLHDLVRFALTGNVYYVSHANHFSKYLFYRNAGVYDGLPCIRSAGGTSTPWLRNMLVYASRGLQTVTDETIRRVIQFFPVTVFFDHADTVLAVDTAACIFWSLVKFEVREQFGCELSEWHRVASRGTNSESALEDVLDGLIGRYVSAPCSVVAAPFHKMFARLHTSSDSNLSWQNAVAGYIAALRRHRELRSQVLIPNFGASGYRVIGWTPVRTGYGVPSEVHDGYDSDAEKRHRLLATQMEYSILTTIMYDFICFLVQSPKNLGVGPAYQVEAAVAITYIYRIQTGITEGPRRYEKGHVNYMTQLLRHVSKDVMIHSGIFRTSAASKDRSHPWRLKPFRYWLNRTQSTRSRDELSEEMLMRLPSIHAPTGAWTSFHARVAGMLTRRTSYSSYIK